VSPRLGWLGDGDAGAQAVVVSNLGVDGAARVLAGVGEELLYQSERTRVVRVRLPGSARSVIRKEQTGPGAAQRLRHEVAVLERLAGVEGVPQLAAGPVGTNMVQLEDAGGVPLATVVPMPVEVPALLELAVGLAGVVAAVHRRGVVHKDINPSNILLVAGSATPVLVDFGLAATFAEERPGYTHQSQVAGTLAYLAPEQTGRTGRWVDRRADLYAVGATLYELATGAPPFGRGEPLQLIHDHLTRVPAPPTELNPAVPQGLSDLILRLLEKEPDRRYQSAEGLLHDLSRLRDELAAGQPGLFRLGRRDFPARLSAPGRPVGREAEIGVLRTAFAEAVAGGGRGLLVAGAPGVGKTALIDELRPIVADGGGWFVAGKFDQYRHDLSSDAVHQTLRALGRLLLAEPEADLAPQRTDLLAALGSNAGLMAGLLPEFGLLLGVPGELPTGDPAQVERRLVRSTVDLLRALATPTRPIVIVLDDLQWAASTPIGLVDAVLADPDLPGLLLVGAYRDSEVDATHPLSGMLSRWARLATAPPLLRLENLPPTDLSALLAEVLRLPAGQAGDLAEAVGARTGGNPYDTIELVNALRLEGSLVAGEDGWAWDAATIRRHIGQGDVVELLGARIDRLPPPTQALLEAMACLGGELELDLLAVAADLPPETLDGQLTPALEDGLLLMSVAPTAVAALSAPRAGGAGSVRFAHDRVQQAAYARRSAGARKTLHLTLARRLAASTDLAGPAAEQYLAALTPDTDAGSAAGPAAAPYNGPDGSRGGPDDAERRRIAELYRAAAAGLRMINYPMAERFLSAATALLTGLAAAGDDALLGALEVDRHAVLYSLGRLDEADELYRSIELRCADPLDLTGPAGVQMWSLSGRGRAAEAMTLGLALLARLGLPTPPDLGAAIAAGLDALSGWVSDTGQAEDPRPELTDPQALGLATMLEKTTWPAFFTDQMTHAWLALESHRLWAERGPCAALMAGLGAAPTLFIVLRQDYRTAYLANRQVLAIGEARGYEPATSLARFLFAACVQHWFAPLESDVDEARQARAGLLRGGDPYVAAFTYNTSIAALLECAPTLDTWADEVEAGLAFAPRVNNEPAANIYLADRQLLRSMRGETAAPGGFTDASFDEAAFLEGPGAIPMVAARFHVDRALAAAVFADQPALARHAGAATALLPFIPGLYVVALAHLLQALALADRARCGAPEDLAGVLAELDLTRAWLADRAADMPGNFGHLLLLVEAERAWAAGDRWGAVAGFDAAVREAQPRRRPWHRALITERAGLCHLAHGLEHTGRTLLREARRHYEAWGATAKVAQLEHLHPFTRNDRAGRRDWDTRGSTTSVSAAALDLMAVLTASQALSSETNLDRLHTRVVEVLGTMTGATTVQLLVRHDDPQQWQLLSTAGGAGVSTPVDEAGAAGTLPVSAFRYAERTGEPLLVPDATRDDRFARDPYLAGLDRCSLLVVPIFTHGVLRAMLLLTNRLSSGAFTADRLDAVELIAGQLAVSLDNAVLYASLEQKVIERTEALAAANERLELLNVTDPLTGLANRRRLEDALQAEWRQSRTSVGLAMVDIDHFKLYNDHYGHLGGDACLRRVATALRRSVRDTDLVARYGGEEFAVIFPGADLASAQAVAERVRAAVVALREPHAAIDGVVTVSIGVATLVPANGASIELLIRLADAELYRAKNNGRNQVSTSTHPTPEPH
jgi:diguanylate cyclase (GGDEF)-like protein